MFRSRHVQSDPTWSDPDGVKIYTISAHHRPVEQTPYLERLAEVKRRKSAAWASIPAFAIFHDGAAAAYLVLAWWGNDNELFTSVSVHTPSGWVEDPARYSFCLWDLEVMWHERNYFVEFIYCPEPSLDGYRAKRFCAAGVA